MLVKKNAHVGLDISNKTWQRPKIYLVNVTWDPHRPRGGQHRVLPFLNGTHIIPEAVVVFLFHQVRLERERVIHHWIIDIVSFTKRVSFR